MKRIINIFLFIFYCALTSYAAAQGSPGEFRNYRSLTTENGLPADYVRCFAHDAEGFMWVGTANGLVRYDGSEVLVFQHDPEDSTSISGNDISALALEGDSVMWVGTMENGLNRLNLRTRKFERFIPRQGRPESIPSREVYTLKHDAHGDLWIGYNRDGFGRYNPANRSFEQVKIAALETSYSNRQNNVIKNFIPDKDNPDRMWVVTLTSLISFNTRTGSLQRYNPYENNPNGIENRLFAIQSGIQAGDGSLYLACSRYGVWKFDPHTTTWTNFAQRHIDPKNRYENTFNLITEIKPGIFWLSSPKRGLFTLKIRDGEIRPFDSAVGERQSDIPSDIVSWDMHNAEGYWLGTTRGVRLYNKQGNQFDVFKFQPEAEWLAGRMGISVLYPIGPDALLFGGYAGEGIYIYNFNTHGIACISPPGSLEKREAQMFFLRDLIPFGDSAMLALTHDALYRLDVKSRKLVRINTGLEFGKDYYSANRILKHSSGKYFISTAYSGVFILDENLRKTGHLQYQADKPSRSIASSNYIYELTEDPLGKVWIGTEDGYSYFDPASGNVSTFDYKLRRDSVPALKTIYRIASAPDSGLWFIDAYAHAAILPYPYEEPHRFIPVYTSNAKEKERVNNVLFDPPHRIFLSTASGLSILRSDGSIRNFTKKEGLPESPPLSSMAMMPDGRMVIAARDEIVSFYPDSLYYTPKRNELHLSSVSVFDRIISQGMDSIMHHGLELTYLQNFFTLNLSLLNFDNPGAYRLSYRLKGLSDSWITTTDKSAVFTNVPGGSYLFEARLIDPDNQPSEQVLSLPVHMIPPLWQRWWFKLITISAGVIAVVLIIVTRFRIMRRKEAFSRELATMELVSLRAQMNPHFIFNSLNSIRHQIITERNEEAEKYLVKFSRLVRWILENSESHYISLDDELRALSLYLELESKRFDGKFEYHIHIDPAIDPRKVAVPGIIIQPFVENAIWHGLMQKPLGGTVSIHISKRAKNLLITITDDGVGREKAREIKSKTARNNNSMGVKITSDRLEVIQKLYNLPCSAVIEDLYDENDHPCGTKVVLTLPLIQNFSRSTELIKS